MKPGFFFTVRFPIALLALFSCLPPSVTYAADGFLVSAAYRNGERNWQPIVLESNNDAMKGRICKFTITNSRVVKCDTVFWGIGQYPAISWDGTRVAFFRFGIYRSNIRNTLEGWTSPITAFLGVGQTGTDSLYGSRSSWWISVIEANGSIRNVVQLQNEPGSEAGIDWPAGDWVYYVSQGSNIRKVNVTTGQDLSVGNCGGSYARRLTMTLDARGAAIQAYGSQNAVFSVPGFSVLSSFPACNVGVSGSGRYAGHYMGGRHCEIWVYKLNDQLQQPEEQEPKPSLWDMADWNRDMCFTTEDVDTVIGCEVIRWSVNSDKWITQSMGWHGHAGNLGRGGNSVLMNWIDREALCVGGNLRIYGDGVLCYGNCAGDFYITGHPGRYEGIDGKWTIMPGYTPTARLSVDTATLTADFGGGVSPTQLLPVTFAQGSPTLSVSDNAAWLASAVEGTGAGQAIRITATTAGLSMGIYYATVTITGGSTPIMLTVALTVAGAAQLSTIAFDRDTLYAQVKGTVQFTPKLLDQFGRTIAGTVAWSVSGGGAVSGTGLFTSNGTPGTYQLTATSGSITGKAWVMVTTLKPLPLAGWLTELLCLETSTGSLNLPEADGAAIRDLHTGANRTVPADGKSVTVNGHAYTWKLRTDADGKWADVSTYDPFHAYFYTTLTSDVNRRAQIVTRHIAQFTAWRNGEAFTYRNFYAQSYDDWAAQFTVTPGGQGIFMELHNDWGGNHLMVRFADPDTRLPLGGVQYYPPGAYISQALPGSAAPGVRKSPRIRVFPGYMRIVTGSTGAITLFRADGACAKISRTMHNGEVTLPIGDSGPGIYLLKVTDSGLSTMRRVVVR